MSKVVVLYDRDYLKKFRVYFTNTVPETIKFAHNMRNHIFNYNTFQRDRIMPDFVHLTTILPVDYDNSAPLSSIVLDGQASMVESGDPWGYSDTYLWLKNPNLAWPKAEPIICEVLCRWFHSHERFGDAIDNVNESRERPIL